MEDQSELAIMRRARTAECEVLQISPATFDIKQYEPIIREYLNNDSITTLSELSDKLSMVERDKHCIDYRCFKASGERWGLITDHKIECGYGIKGNGQLKFGDLIVLVIHEYNSYN